ncbi:hypothetical protein [Longitalea luteola]|uniref:hypothetical protein n=1 Tax=Longitalea luteola TaxID=2812563 RepID=UPI001A959822|nr:hypothetical protein [Longitalea luteola]
MNDDDKRYLRFNAVYIIDSLNNDEMQTGEALHGILRYIQYKIEFLKCKLFKVNSKIELIQLFKGLNEEVHAYGTHPFLHFEVHGSREGLVLNSNEAVSWKEIADLLRDINIKTRNNTIVSLATCYGGFIYESILPSLPAPFFAIIGPWNPVTSDEIMASFTRFFEFLFATENLNDIDFDLAVEKLNENNDLTEKFGFYHAEIVYDRIVSEYEEKLKNPEEFNKRVESMVEFGLRIEGITNNMTLGEMRKACELYLKNPNLVRQKMKSDFLMRG